MSPLTPSEMKPIKAVAFLLLLLLSTPLAAADRCLKEVFGSYCLGGAVSTLQQSYPADSQTETDGQLKLLYNAAEPVKVESREGIITSVTKLIPPGSWLNFETWKRKLVRLYHQPEKLGQFPTYASSRSSKLNAVNAGRGFAHDRWPQDGWSINLIWNHRDHILLRYQLDEPAAPPTDNDEKL